MWSSVARVSLRLFFASSLLASPVQAALLRVKLPCELPLARLRLPSAEEAGSSRVQRAGYGLGAQHERRGLHRGVSLRLLVRVGARRPQ
eukprot:2755482-Rhodomonas_salina.1